LIASLIIVGEVLLMERLEERHWELEVVVLLAQEDLAFQLVVFEEPLEQ